MKSASLNPFGSSVPHLIRLDQSAQSFDRYCFQRLSVYVFSGQQRPRRFRSNYLSLNPSKHKNSSLRNEKGRTEVLKPEVISARQNRRGDFASLLFPCAIFVQTTITLRVISGHSSSSNRSPWSPFVPFSPSASSASTLATAAIASLG